jgi:hypothetical protein
LYRYTEETFDEIRSAAALNLGASLALAFLVLLLSTRDIVIAALATSCIGSVVATVLGAMKICGGAVQVECSWPITSLKATGFNP